MKKHRLADPLLFRQASDLDAGHLHKALAALKRCLYLRRGGREAFFHAMRAPVRYYLTWAAHWRQKAGRVLPC